MAADGVQHPPAGIAGDGSASAGDPRVTADLARVRAEEHAARAEERELLGDLGAAGTSGIPLRRRVLRELALAPRGSAEVAADLDVPGAAIDRLLCRLTEEGLVHAEHQRGRVYRLTLEGAQFNGRHALHGTRPEPPGPLTHDAVTAFLEKALDDAVRRRQQRDDLEDVRGRLQAIVREAERVEAGGIAQRARRELAALRGADDGRAG